MNGKKPSAKIDARLEPLLPPASDEQVDEGIARLISVYAEPVIKGIIRYKLHLSSHHATQRAEADDVYQDALVQFLAELRQFRRQPDVYPITDVSGLAAVIAHRTCSRWMRRQFPERHSLKARIHYLMTRQRGLALWQNENGKQVAGFAEWKGKTSAATPERLARLSDQEGLLGQIESLKTNSVLKEPGGALAAVLNYLAAQWN
jgi:DNA-directed RNA polymerase specialized sigma24 family protein